MKRVTAAGLAAAALIAGAAAAQEPEYFRAPGHPLTVRDAPAGTPIGELARGAAPIEATGVDDSGAWARIAFGEGDGWVALDALTTMRVPDAAYGPLPAGLLCAGSEPFWSARFGPETVETQAPGEEPQSFAVDGAVVAQGAARFPLAVRIGEMTAVLRPGACFDGMSDRTHAWSVDLLIARPGALALRTGCCRLPPAR